MSGSIEVPATRNVEVDRPGPTYITVLPGKTVHRTEEIEPGVNIDFDDAGHVIGIEVLVAKQLAYEPALSS